MKKSSFISLALSSVFFGGVVWGTDISLDLSTGESETTSGRPISFKYAFKKDGATATSPDTKVEENTNYFWSNSSGNTLSLVEKTESALKQNTPLVATAIFTAPGNSDSLMLESFNYISVGSDTTTKGQSDTYFAVLNGPNPYTNFTLNGANIFSGSNFYVGPIGGTNSKTGGFASVTLKGTIKVNANAVDQSDSGSSGQKEATLNFQSEYNDATYTIDSDATIDLTSTGSQKSTINFNLGETKDSTKATGQSVVNKGTIKISNAESNSTVGSVSEEKNNINFLIDLNNEGKITLENATLTFKDSALKITDDGSVGTISITAKENTKDKLSSEATNNKSSFYFDSTSSTTAKSFEIASQSISIAGTAPSDASSDTENQELFGAQLTIKVNNTGIPSGGAKDLILTGSKDKLTSITIGASADSGTVNDKNTSLIFDATTVSLDNYASITVQSGATLNLKSIAGTDRTYTATSTVSVQDDNGSGILDFNNQGTITFKGDGVNTNILDASGKKVILTDYAVTKTTCKVGDTDCSSITEVSNIPKNATLTTTIEEEAGVMEFSGGKTQIKAQVAYNYGEMKLSDSATLDLSQLTESSNQFFYNAGVFTSTGGTIDTRTTQESSSTDYDGLNKNKKSNTKTDNTKALVITEAKKEKTTDASDSGVDKGSSNFLQEGGVWAANKSNESRAEFVVDSGATVIRSTTLTNNGLTTIQNGGTLNLYCVGTDYCYDGRYWTNAADNDSNGKEYVKAPDLTSSKTGTDSDKFKATQITFTNGDNGTLSLAGGTLNTIDTYKYQDKDNSYEDVTKNIYHSLKITKGTLEAAGGTNSIIQSGFDGTNSALTLDDVNLALRGDSRLLITSLKDTSTTYDSSSTPDVTWKAGSSGNTFTMYLSDDDYTKNTRGFYILGTADSDGNYTGGTIKFTDSGGSSGAMPDFVIDLSDLSGKNTILLNQQYNFIVAGKILKGDSEVSSISDFNMKINFGKGPDTSDSGADKPTTDEEFYGSYNETLCKTDAKFCLDADATNGGKASHSSGGEIVIGGISSSNEGVVVVDGSSKLDNITSGWPSNGKTSVYSDFVTFNKIYQQGTGTCDFNTLEGCAIIGFSAVKSKTLEKDGVSAVFQSIKDRYNQLPNTENTVIKNTLTGINRIENANPNADKILQGIVDTSGVASSTILLNLQKFQYTGDLSLAQQVVDDINTLDNSFDALANITQDNLELISRVNFTSTLNTAARLAQNSNPYRESVEFAKAIKSLENKKFADVSSSLYSYTDRFDYDHNAWAMAIGGFGGKYSGGYNALGGISAGYDRMLGRVLLGGYATYAYAISSLSSFNNDTRVKTDNSSNNLEIGAYMRAYIDAHEIDAIVSETFGFNSLDLNNSLTSQNIKSSNFTTNITARYGYVFPIDINNGLYIKPIAGLTYMYQYNSRGTGSTDAKINFDSRHSNTMSLSAFVEVRKYVDDKKYLYIMPGLEQDLFSLTGNSQIYFASSANNSISYKIDNLVRTYLTVIGGGEIGIKDHMAITFGVGAKISWDRYFINGNVGFKYKFNSN